MSRHHRLGKQGQHHEGHEGGSPPRHDYVEGGGSTMPPLRPAVACCWPFLPYHRNQGVLRLGVRRLLLPGETADKVLHAGLRMQGGWHGDSFRVSRSTRGRQARAARRQARREGSGFRVAMTSVKTNWHWGVPGTLSAQPSPAFHWIMDIDRPICLFCNTGNAHHSSSPRV